MKNPQVLQYPLSEQAIHIDFLRLRCGSEETFQEGINAVRQRESEAVHAFIAFSEWDALIVVPSSELYPRTLTNIYANAQVASSVSGTSGYFAYLWKHPINDNWPERLNRLERSGPTILTSLRFADWFRRDVGLGAELLFCNYFHELIESDKYKGIGAIVAHSLGWNDVILFTHAESDEERLTDLLADVRLTTLRNCIGGSSETLGFSAGEDSQIFAASYTHLLGGFDTYLKKELSLGSLAPLIDSARLLVRVAPPHEQEVRAFMNDQRVEAGVNVVPSEMGHYSLSIDISGFTKSEGGKRAIAFVADTRRFIGGLRKGATDRKNEPDSYAETTTIFRFVEPDQKYPSPPALPMPPELLTEIETVERVMGELPHLLHQLGASSMTSHRFVSVLLTLLDHLSDPVRSSVVRHLSRFARTIPDLVRELDSDGIDDLCHVLEYAVGQAIDGIAQFQHDANALGLSGRGGYSRLIVAVEWFIHSTFARLGIPARMPLITFGLRSGNAGSTRRYQIDIPFNVLFVPSRWHILLHEVGHLAWQHNFSWMMESLAIFRAMEREIRIEIRRDLRKKKRKVPTSEVNVRASERVHVEFLRTREILRELFPNFLIFALPCGGKLGEMDALTLRHMMSLGHPSSVTRELLIAVVTHCLIEIMDTAVKESADPRIAMTDIQRATKWWNVWEPLKNETQDERIRVAVREFSETISKVTKDARKAKQEQDSRADTPRPTKPPGMQMRILHSDSFAKAAAETLHSTIQVLALRARHFVDPDAAQLAPMQFGRLLSRIVLAQLEQSHPAYNAWMGHQFADWLNSGEVLPKHRDSFIWSRLLLGSRAELVSGGRASIMRSQLSVLLSMWHDAITEGYRAGAKQPINDLGIVRPKEPPVPLGAIE